MYLEATTSDQQDEYEEDDETEIAAPKEAVESATHYRHLLTQRVILVCGMPQDTVPFSLGFETSYVFSPRLLPFENHRVTEADVSHP